MFTGRMPHDVTDSDETGSWFLMKRVYNILFNCSNESRVILEVVLDNYIIRVSHYCSFLQYVHVESCLYA